jgi:hypothetical protein
MEKLLFGKEIESISRTKCPHNFCFQGGQRAFHCRGALLATKGEREITKILNEKLSPSYIEVRDISGALLIDVLWCNVA